MIGVRVISHRAGSHGLRSVFQLVAPACAFRRVGGGLSTVPDRLQYWMLMQ